MPIYDLMLTEDRWLNVATFPWEAVRGEDPQPWDLYQPTLRDLVVGLSGRVDYTTYTTEHVEQLSAMLDGDLLGLKDDLIQNPEGEAVTPGSDDD